MKEINNLLDLHADGGITQKWVSNKFLRWRGQTASCSGKVQSDGLKKKS